MCCQCQVAATAAAAAAAVILLEYLVNVYTSLG